MRSPAIPVFILFSFAVFGHACTNFKKMCMIASPGPVLDVESAVRSGAAIFQKHCVACHGQTGAGDGPQAQETRIFPADLPRLAKQKSVKSFAANIYYGKAEHMPAFKDTLSGEEIWHVAHFVKSLGAD